MRRSSASATWGKLRSFCSICPANAQAICPVPATRHLACGPKPFMVARLCPRRGWYGFTLGRGRLMERFLIGIAGIAVILAIAVLLSSNRRAIRLRVVGAAFALQVVIATLV
ncbi:Na+ dependent nucleoside transporter N-terminal domain-containing protein, partial [Escherichia coli]|uniref:Na+ dependent nucleoside transporter N-terminal domain-containing protein n=1 Tax=Escherichia coli TaxID=562 RepID=UPI0027B92353